MNYMPESFEGQPRGSLIDLEGKVEPVQQVWQTLGNDYQNVRA